MNAKSLCIALVLSQPTQVFAQGYAGLGTQAEGFAIPERGARLSFPLDHGPHPEYRIEWWYLTANLNDKSGREYGVQWTLFRSALAPEEQAGWSSPQIWMGHAGLTSEDSHFFEERLARGGIAQAGVSTSPFTAWIDNWQMVGQDTDLQDLSLTASGSDFAYTLALSAQTPLALHGENGYSVKSANGQASYYYSQPKYEVTGTLTFPDGPVEVTGHGWLDREWSSQPLAEDQRGWDWFSLSFDSGEQLMGFQLRGQNATFTSGSWIGIDGTTTSLAPGLFQAEPLSNSDVNGRTIPTQWQVTLPHQNVSVTVQAINTQSWMGTSFPYWEGPVKITGSHTGRGYLEMTGYD